MSVFHFWGSSQMGSLHPEPALQFWPVMPTTPILIVAKTAKVRSRMGYAMLAGRPRAVGFVACPHSRTHPLCSLTARQRVSNWAQGTPGLPR